MNDLISGVSYTWSTSSTSEAAVLGALGFPLRSRVTEDDPSRSSRVDVQWEVGEKSLWTELWLEPLLKEWRRGELCEHDPLHPLLMGMRARQNVQYIQKAQYEGMRIRLVGTKGSYASTYEWGEELPNLTLAEECVQTEDVALAGALGTVGIPVIEITGNGLRSQFVMPNKGHWLKGFPEGNPAVQYEARHLMRRSGEGFDLALEHEEPQHPLVAAYRANVSYQILLKHLKGTGRRLMLRPPGTQRTALIGLNAEGRVMDKVQKHFKVV